MQLPPDVQAMIKELEYQRDSYAARCVVLQGEAARRGEIAAKLQEEVGGLKAQLAELELDSAPSSEKLANGVTALPDSLN